MHLQIYKYSMQYLNDEEPPQSNHWICTALRAEREDWLQVAVVDSVQSLGGTCHSFGLWNPCLTSKLEVSEEVEV